MTFQVVAVDVADVPSVVTQFACVGSPVCHDDDVRAVEYFHGGIVLRREHDSVLHAFHGFVIKVFLLTACEVKEDDLFTVVRMLYVCRLAVFKAYAFEFREACFRRPCFAATSLLIAVPDYFAIFGLHHPFVQKVVLPTA